MLRDPPEDAMTCFVAFFLALASMLQYPPTGGTPPGETPDDSKEVRILTDNYEKASKDPEKDKVAVGMLDTLVAKYKESAPRDRGRILKLIVASAKMSDAPTEKVPKRNLPLAACEHIPQIGAEALKPIQELMVDRKIAVDMARLTPLAAGLVRIGIGTDEALTAAYKMLDDSNPRLYAALAPAFAAMDLETQAKRKKVAAALLAAHETFATRVEKDKSVAADAKSKLVTEGDAGTIATLNALSLQKHPNIDAFKAWFAENKDKDWPEK
jgi:hypothetical protein